MKKILVLIILFICNSMIAQNIDWTSNTIDHNPNPKNELSKYFKKEVPKKYLRKANFQPKKNNIVLSFSINNENKPYRISITSFGTPELQKSIKEAFENYPLEKLNLKSLDKKNRYHFQIISKKGYKKIFNCSSKIIVESPPVCNSCEDLEFFEDIKTCLNLEVKKHFYKNVNFNLLKKITSSKKSNLTDEKDIELLLSNEVKLFVQFSVNEEGKLINKKTKVPTILNNEVIKALNTFPVIIKPGTINGIEKQALYSFTVLYKKDETPIYKKRYQEYEDFSKPSVNNELSKYFIEKLSENDLEKINLNRIYNRLIISFEMDKNNTPFNFSTNARSKEVDENMIALFKNLPVSKLNFSDITPFNYYSFQLASFTDNKTIINASSSANYIRNPIYPGCEKSKDNKSAKKCFSKGVQKSFIRKFNSKLPNNLGLSPGKLRVNIYFKINIKGEVSNVSTKLSRPSYAITNEVKRVMKLLPKMTFAPIRNGKPVNVKYNIPFTLIIE